MNVWTPFRTCDIANGPGVRVTLFVAGCRIHCKNCFNSECWDFDSGEPFTDQIKDDILKALDNHYITGITILGGEPMEPENQEGLLPLLTEIRNKFPTKSIWCYTGYVYDKDLVPGGKRYIEGITNKLLDVIDTLVDGPFVEELKDPNLEFRGSSNQRILHLKELR